MDADLSDRQGARPRQSTRLFPHTRNLGVKVFRGAHPYWVIRNLEGLLPLPPGGADGGHSASQDGQRDGKERPEADTLPSPPSPSPHVQAGSMSSSTPHQGPRPMVIGLNGELVDVRSVDPGAHAVSSGESGFGPTGSGTLAGPALADPPSPASSSSLTGPFSPSKSPSQAPATLPPGLEVWGLTGWLVNVFMKRAGWWMDFPEVKAKQGREGVKAML